MSRTQYELSQKETRLDNLISKLYGRMESDVTIPLTSSVGKGYYRYISPSRSLEMYISDVVFEEDTVLSEKADRDAFSVTFCLSDELEWQNEFDTEHIILHRGECVIYQNGIYRMKNFYKNNVRYIGVGINIYPKRFPWLTTELTQRCLAINPSCKAETIPIFHFTKNIESILQQILACNYDDTLKAVYIEGKFLELVASFTHEVLQGKKPNVLQPKHTFAEAVALDRVRTLIHEHLENPLTISDLAKECFISESKLRQAFRTQYGTTIYQYTIDCRMDWAKQLFDEYHFSVKEVSATVGYTNISHFTAAFKSRFACTPRQYLNRIYKDREYET